MGVNLIPIVRNFMVDIRNFPANDCAVVEGCVSPGIRKLLRFDFLCWNAGDTDLRVGRPSDHPQWYEFSPCHGHYHLKDFNTFTLYDCNGAARAGSKQAFCLIDLERRSGGHQNAQFTDCNSNQGISAGWADIYARGLDCQWVDITGLPDGDYTLEATTNSNSLVGEDRYGDNRTWAGVRIQGNTVTEIPVPCYREDCIGFNPANVQAVNIGGRWKVVDGSHWILDFGSSQAHAERARDIIKHYAMNQICFVGRPSRDQAQLMMYFLVNGNAPVGHLPGEDAILIDTNNIRAEWIQLPFGIGFWVVTDGRSILLNFGRSQANAVKAASIIRKYGFKFQCFVGRPNPHMMYFRVDPIKGKEKEKEKEDKDKEKEKEDEKDNKEDKENAKENAKEKDALKEKEDEFGGGDILFGDSSRGGSPQMLNAIMRRLDAIEQRLATGQPFIRSEQRPPVGDALLAEAWAAGSDLERAESEETPVAQLRPPLGDEGPQPEGEPQGFYEPMSLEAFHATVAGEGVEASRAEYPQQYPQEHIHEAPDAPEEDPSTTMPDAPTSGTDASHSETHGNARSSRKPRR